jgi:hypothetical protein
MDVRSILLHPQFETLVNTLSLRLSPWFYNEFGVWTQFCRSTTRSGPPCPCDKLDEALGRALNGLINLRMLRLDCRLCRPDGVDRWDRVPCSYERHRYLTTLQTNVLQEVKFHCKCSIINEKALVEYLGASCMTPVTTLGWSTCGQISPNGYLKASLTNPSILPNLSVLFCVSDVLNHLLVQCRPIQKIGASGERGQGTINLEDLIKKRGKLTHVCIQRYYDAVSLIRTITADPFHSGTFSTWAHST